MLFKNIGDILSCVLAVSHRVAPPFNVAIGVDLLKLKCGHLPNQAIIV